MREVNYMAEKRRKEEGGLWVGCGFELNELGSLKLSSIV